MSESEKTLFREKNLQIAAGPEKLDGYLKVTSIGPWFVLLAAALVLAAVFLWVFFGKVQTTVTGAGYCENGVLRCYVARSEISEITEKSAVMADKTQGEVVEIDSDLHSLSEVPDEIHSMLPPANWYSTVQLACPLEDGLYTVTFSQKSAAPFSLRMQGE